MTATNHALAGAAIAVTVNSPLALPLAFVAHFVMDAIPHSDLKPKEIWVDIFIAAFMTAALVLFLGDKFSPWLVFGSVIACASPDLVWGWRYYKLSDFKKAISPPWSSFSQWHQKIQWSETRLGILVELVWLVAVLGFIIERYRSL